MHEKAINLKKVKNNTEIFSDKGFSGKSINRPEFQRMMEELRENRIKKIIVYKVDRISRSMLDFLNMQMNLINMMLNSYHAKKILIHLLQLEK